MFQRSLLLAGLIVSHFVLQATALALQAESRPSEFDGGGCVPQWSNQFSLPGLNGRVLAMTSFDDGGKYPSLYLGGSFTAAQSTALNRVARWDGTDWSAVGSGLTGNVHSLIVFDDGDGGGPALFAAGDFVQGSVNRIAKWTGTQWQPLGAGLNGSARAMAIFDDGTGNGPALFVAGSFTTAGGVQASGIAKWNGQAWSALPGAGVGTNDIIRSLAVHDDGQGPALFVGGSFTSIGGIAANRLARFDGSGWQSIGSIDNGHVHALAVMDQHLFVGGSFTSVNSAAAANVVQFNGASLTAAGTLPASVWSFAVHDNGTQPTLFASAGYGVHRWNGSQWENLADANDIIHAIAVVDDGFGSATSLYAGGAFSSAGLLHANHIARLTITENSTTWSNLSLGAGISGEIRALVSGSVNGQPERLFAGGRFNAAGQVIVSNIAQFTGVAWQPIATGIDQFSPDAKVHALAILQESPGGEGVLYAAGQFASARGAPASNIARFNGSAWSPLAQGTNGTVHALAAFDDGSGPAMFVAGAFTAVPGINASYIAKWNGSAWADLGPETNGPIYALAVFDNGSGPALFATGNFTAAGTTPAAGIAKWNGTAWSALADGINGIGRSLAVFDDGSGPALYVGGEFTAAGTIGALGIARWNGSSWSSVGGGVGGSSASVNAMCVADDGSGAPPALYIGGQFTTAGGIAATNIARWNGSTWEPLDDGLMGVPNQTAAEVHALTPFDDGMSGPALYAGGSELVFAGEQRSSRVARWGCPHEIPQPDCNQNGISDYLEIASGQEQDCNGNSSLDSCDLAAGISIDMNANSVPDECEPAPIGPSETDQCVNALLIQAGTYLFTNIGATTDGVDEPNACSFNGYSHIENDVWFKYVSTCDGTVRVSLCGTDFDAKMAVYFAGCPPTAQLLACSDNFCDQAPRVSFQAQANTVYRIRIGGYQGDMGVGVLQISCTSCQPDLNGDQLVNVSDLLAVINGWGPCPGGAQPCPADANGDLLVNVSDLLMVINAWGACP